MYTRRRIQHRNDLTHKISSIPETVQGWLVIRISGSPYQRGYQHGVAIASEFAQLQDMLKFITWENLAMEWQDIIEIARTEFSSEIKNNFREFYEEMEGIADGCTEAGTPTNIHEIVAWNNYITIVDCYLPYGKNEPRKKSDRCSAFIATGSYTKDGKIVMAHNSFCEFVDGQYYNIILDIQPSSGNRILMQTAPGCI
jgi:hypothetical protein